MCMIGLILCLLLYLSNEIIVNASFLILKQLLIYFDEIIIEYHHKQRNCKYHPVVEIESYYIQHLCRLIYLRHRLLRIKQSKDAAEYADIYHIILYVFVFRPEHKRKQRDISRAYIHKPRVAKHSCFIDRVRRNIRL